MTQDIILLSLAILPVLLLATFVYRKDSYQKEPIGMLFKAFFFGCLSVIPAIFLEQFLTDAYMGPSPSWIEGAYTGYIVAGCSEELSKLLLLLLAVWRSRHFDEYFDGIVYAAFVGLGFAGLENIMYVFNQTDFTTSFMTGSMRALLSVPGHFLFAVVMGYYFARAKFEPEHRGGMLFKAFFFPMLLHGTFDALLMIPEAMGESGSWLSVFLFPVFIYFDIKLWKIGMRRLNHLQELSRQQQFEGGPDAWHTGYENSDDDDYSGSGYHNGSAGDDPFKGFKWDV